MGPNGFDLIENVVAYTLRLLHPRAFASTAFDSASRPELEARPDHDRVVPRGQLSTANQGHVSLPFPCVGVSIDDREAGICDVHHTLSLLSFWMLNLPVVMPRFKRGIQ